MFMKEKIKSIGIAAALVICVAVTACDNSNTEQYNGENTTNPVQTVAVK